MSVTTELTEWICKLRLEDVPTQVQQRAKCMALDGIACGLVASHLPWSSIGTEALLEIESPGACGIWGWDKKVGPLCAALLNSSFVQGFELDDFHRRSPNHAMSLMLPSLIAAIEHETSKGHSITGNDLLLALIVGLEVTPRIGLALGGVDLLNRGIHSGTLMGHIGVAASVSKLLGLSPQQTEHALGTAATQACGLMSAQAGAMVKRMQHGFAARNGLLAVFLSRSGFTGIEQILDVPYGGFYSVWSRSERPAAVDEVCDELGVRWETLHYAIKEHAAMGAVQTPIECLAKIQDAHPRVNDISSIKNINIAASAVTIHHGCFPLPPAPVPTVAAQMVVGFAIASQLLDGEVFVTQFTQEQIDRPLIREIVEKKVTYEHASEFDEDKNNKFACRITVTFNDGSSVSETLKAARAILPGLSDEDILMKVQKMLKLVVSDSRTEAILALITSLDRSSDLAQLSALLSSRITSPI